MLETRCISPQPSVPFDINMVLYSYFFNIAIQAGSEPLFREDIRIWHTIDSVRRLLRL
jgi:hypothetical protein